MKIGLNTGSRLRGFAVAVTLALTWAPVATTAQADDWPNQPITMVVPFNAGGSTDLLARSLASFLPDKLGQPVTVLNRPGAGGQIGVTWYLQQPSDGNTILVTSALPYLPNNILTTGAKYTLEDFAFINAQWIDYTIVAVPQSSPYETLADLISEIRENPGQLSTSVTYASAGHLMTLVLLDSLGIPQDNIKVVTYDGGSQARNALASGQVDFGVDQGQGLLGYKDNVRALAVVLREKTEDWDAPLINDELKPMNASVPILFGSTRTIAVSAEFKKEHPERYAKLVEAVKSLMSDKGYNRFAGKSGVPPTWRGPEETTQLIEENFEVLKKYLKLMNK